MSRCGRSCEEMKSTKRLEVKRRIDQKTREEGGGGKAEGKGKESIKLNKNGRAIEEDMKCSGG